MEKYVLINKKPVQEPDVMKWGKFMSSSDRIVLQESLGEYLISTVFLGLDHGFLTSEPLLFETMIFQDKKVLDYQTRCSTYEQAEGQHKEAIKWLAANFAN